MATSSSGFDVRRWTLDERIAPRPTRNVQREMTLLGWLELFKHQRERPAPEGAVDVRVLIGWPAGPVRLVTGDAVVPLGELRGRQARQPEVERLVEDAGQLVLLLQWRLHELIDQLVVGVALPAGDVDRGGAQRARRLEVPHVEVRIDPATTSAVEGRDIGALGNLVEKVWRR